MKTSTNLPHKIPADLKKAIFDDSKIKDLWTGLTELGRNEFVCWVLSAKLPATRTRRIRRTCEELTEGKRRPCCWPGCPHRKNKNMQSK